VFEHDGFTYTEAELAMIKELRCGKILHSYRALARKFTRANPEFVKRNKLEEMADKEYMLKELAHAITVKEAKEMTPWENGNQLLGQDLCMAAAKYYGEENEGEW
jgi:hypothetical protein